ncbi:MAG TPA: ATP-binding protein [Burkholderiaceae bacterium]|nr:ATP-binding protein [Burkholderiaceae bacterium]
MLEPSLLARIRGRLQRAGRGLLVWAVAWAAMLAFDPGLDLANLALVLVLAAALAGLWLAPAASAFACTLAVLAFNWTFVPPRGSFSVDLHQHLWLLATMLAVAWIVATLVARQRRLAEAEQRAAAQARQLRAMGDALRDTDDPLSRALDLQDALATLSGPPVRLLMLRTALPSRDDEHAAAWLGEPDGDARAGLWLCTRQAAALGPGSGRHEDQLHWYLPMRGRGAAWGAAQLPAPADAPDPALLRAHAQALVDQMGLALERAQALRAAEQAREQAQVQQLRNALLAAIAHDHRTPLATILGAASSLQAQDAQLQPAQRQRLAASIVEEAERLSRLTENTLQLARLDAPGLTLALDWESGEELAGSALARVRRHDPQRRVRVRVEPGLPLLRCDAVLLVQMLVNLLENALKHGAPDAPVELWVKRVDDGLMFAVRDRGPGVPPEQRERIFEVFQRGAGAPGGAGVGLALARAVARVHGGRLTLRARHHGGAAFECVLPLAAAPPMPGPEAVP